MKFSSNDNRYTTALHLNIGKLKYVIFQTFYFLSCLQSGTKSSPKSLERIISILLMTYRTLSFVIEIGTAILSNR